MNSVRSNEHTKVLVLSTRSNTMVKELEKLTNEEILNQELIGGGIPDLGTELAKIQAGQVEETQPDEIGFEGFGFEENQEDEED